MAMIFDAVLMWIHSTFLWELWQTRRSISWHEPQRISRPCWKFADWKRTVWEKWVQFLSDKGRWMFWRTGSDYAVFCWTCTGCKHGIGSRKGRILPRRAQCAFDAWCQKCFCVTFDKSNKTRHHAAKTSFYKNIAILKVIAIKRTISATALLLNLYRRKCWWNKNLSEHWILLHAYRGCVPSAIWWSTGWVQCQAKTKRPSYRKLIRKDLQRRSGKAFLRSDIPSRK